MSEYHNTTVHPDRYFWHDSIARELFRLREECGKPGYNVRGIAGNIGQFPTDTERYVRQMIEWDELVEIEPLWDYPGLWVALADAA